MNIKSARKKKRRGAAIEGACEGESISDVEISGKAEEANSVVKGGVVTVRERK